jgi:hypothetical protein
MSEQINITQEVTGVSIVVTQSPNNVTLTTGGNTTEINVNTEPKQVELTISNGAVKGDSAYQVWLNLGNTGDEQDFIDSLRPFNMTIGPTPPVDPEVNDLWIDTNI